MRQELQRRISNARHRIDGGVVTEDERSKNREHLAVEDYKDFLAQRIDFITRTELLMEADYIWQKTGPMVRLVLDTHAFVLARVDNGLCRLWEETESTAVDIGRWSSIRGSSAGGSCYGARIRDTLSRLAGCIDNSANQ